MNEETNYVVKLTADISNFSKNMDAVGAKLALTEKQTAAFSARMEKALSSANPAAQVLGRNMKTLADQYNAQIAQFKRYGEAVENAGQRLRELAETQEQQRTAISQTEAEVSKLTSAYAEAVTRQNQMRAAMEAGNSVKADIWAKVNNDVSATGEALEQMTERLNEQRAALESTETQMAQWSNTAQLSAENARDVATQADATRLSMLKIAEQSDGLTRTASFFKDIGAKVSSLSAQLANLSKNSIKKTIDGFQNWIARAREAHQQTALLNTAVHKLTNTFNSFAYLLVRRFKRQLISDIFNGLKEGIHNVAAESTSFNAAMSQMFGATKTFSNALGAAFAPLIETVTPIISGFINYLTGAVNTVSQLTASLTGKSSFMKAIPVVYDYAKSLDSTANSASKAAKETEKQTKATQRSVLAFDQLNKLNGQTEANSSASSSSIDLNTIESNFQNTNIDGKVKGIADQLAAAFKAHDWDKLGGLMAAGVNKAFAWIDDVIKWEKSGKRIAAVCDGIAKTVNSFVSHINWELIGNTFGDGINTIINTILLLQRGIDWKAIGDGFGRGVNALLECVNWRNAGAAIVGGVQLMLDIVNGFVTTDGLFDNIGAALSDGLAGAIDSIDSTKWGATLAAIVNGVFSILAGLFSNAEKYAELGVKIAANINQLFRDLNPAQFADAINNMLNAFMAVIGGLISSLEWDTIGGVIGAAVSRINWVKALQVVGVVLLATLTTRIPALLSTALTHIAGLIPGLLSVIFAHPIIAGIAVLAGVLIYEIVKHWDDVVAFFKGIPKALEGFFSTLEKKVNVWWAGVTKWAHEKFTNATNAIRQTFEGIAAAIGGVFNNIRETAERIWAQIQKCIEDPIGTAKESIAHIVNSIGNLLGFEGLTSKISTALSGVYDAITAPFRNAWQTVSGIIEKIKQFNPLDAARNVISSVPRVIGNVIDIGGFAGGGFPEDGLFLANSGEMVGGFTNGKTAVANNDQIVSGIQAGVTTAIMNVLPGLLSDVKPGNGGDVVLFVDSEELARASMRGASKLDKRYNSSKVQFA